MWPIFDFRYLEVDGFFRFRCCAKIAAERKKPAEGKSRVMKGHEGAIACAFYMKWCALAHSNAQR